MRFNGMDPVNIHPALSINKEIPPGTARRHVNTAKTADGEIVTGVEIEAAFYTVRMNIGAWARETAWEVRELLAAWAGSSGAQTAELVPTDRPQRCYDAILESIGDPEFKRGFATIDVVFLLPRPVSRSVNASIAQGVGGMNAMIQGSSPARPVIRQTLSGAASRIAWTMDGKKLFAINGSFAAGQTIEMDTTRGLVRVDGASAMAKLDPQNTEWRPGFTRGAHTFESTDGGKMEMRWHEEWL